MKEFVFNVEPSSEEVPYKVTTYKAHAENLNSAIEEALNAVGVDFCIQLASIRLLTETVSAPRIILSQQEFKIAIMISKGMVNKEIAAELHISINTVKHHVGWINAKLDVHNRTQIANRVLSNGIQNEQP